MSNQQWPGQGAPRPGQGNPWAQQDPNWRPPQFQEHAGRDPRQPFGAQPAAPQLPDLEPPGKPVWPWIVGILGVVAALLLFLVFQPEGTQEPPPEQPPATAFPSPSTTGNALPYEGNGTGVFTIVDYRWTSSGIEIDYEVTADDEPARFAFFAFLNDTRESFVPDGDPTIEAAPGSPATGTVTIPMPRGDASVVLTTASGRAITALPVKG